MVRYTIPSCDRLFAELDGFFAESTAEISRFIKVTVTKHSKVFCVPSAKVTFAYTRAVPFASPVTSFCSPLVFLMEMILESLTVHATLSAVICPVVSLMERLFVPSVMVRSEEESVTSFPDIGTVTTQLAFMEASSSAVAVIVAVPALCAVTNPFSSTVATVLLSDVHATSLLYAFAGSTAAVSILLSFFESVIVLSLNVIWLTLFLLTLTLQVYFLFPSTSQVMVSFSHSFFAFTAPVFGFTSMQSGFELVHVHLRFLPFTSLMSDILSLKLSFPPRHREIDFLLIFGFTFFTLQ